MARSRKAKRKKSNGRTSAGPRRRPRARRGGKPTQLAFEALAIEGGLLSADWLARAAQLEAGGQNEADYRIPKGLNLRDEIGRYWRIAQALWSDLIAGREAAEGDEDRLRAVAERFVTALLRECFGFTSLAAVDPFELEGRAFPIGHAALDGRVPVVIAPAGTGLDALSPVFGDGARRRSGFGLCQEFLNAEDRALWGLASDGFTLRVLRDNASLTRPAWIQADLARIFSEERYSDFAALWLIIHETRFGRPDRPVTECALEAWREAGREEGTRARDQLRHGVEDALAALGQGFLAHAENQPLRSALASGALTKEAYFQELLRLAYRLIFLLTVEERGVLHPGSGRDASDEPVRKLYAEGYSLRRLRERAVKRSAHDRHHDHWESVKIVFRGLATGEPRLALPALAGIFAKEQCATLDAARLENRYLLLALFRLSWLREEAGLARVNWRDMGPEELGSVYESLLELVPQITEGGRAFSFATGAETKGHARKTTGSYYTPDSLVQVLLDSALEPVIERTIAENPRDAVEALLSLSVVDPACGSGHFLLAAARRLAAHVARLQADGTPSAAEYRHALRRVVGRCIYGVDLNPMAVELCKVSLWMEAVEPGLPLTFLDSHIRHGNALLGTTPELMEKGIPDEAWKPIEGDDKKVASALKKRNKESAKGQRGLDTLWSKPKVDEADELRRATAALESAPDADAAALAAKESRWKELLDSEAYQHQKLVADAWCAAFVWPKRPGSLAEAAPTNELWRQIRDRQGNPPDLTVKTVKELAEQYFFFHWHLAFPQVFGGGGFDVVLGNPPWERVTLKEKEWFVNRDPSIAAAGTGAQRLKRIALLQESNPALYRDFILAKRRAAGEKVFLRNSEAYPHCGRGDVNTFAVFAELGRRLSRGRAGMVLPTGIVTTDTTQDFVADLVERGHLVSVFDFDNRSGIFPAVQGNVRFCLLTTAHEHQARIVAAAQLRAPAEIFAAGRCWTLSPDDIRRINPNTRTMPLFPAERDAVIAKRFYVRHHCVDEVDVGYPGKWVIPMQRMLHMGDDSHLFKTASQLLAAGFERRGYSWFNGSEQFGPLFEAKLCHQFDHRAATFDGIPEQARYGTHPATRELGDREHLDPDVGAEPRYWVPLSEVRARVGSRRHLLAFRDAVSAVADSRSLVATVVPPHGAGDTLKFLFVEDPEETAVICSWFNAFATDFVFRLKASGAHASFFILRQLPIPTRDHLLTPCSWDVARPVSDWLLPRVVELTYTAWDLEPFAKDVGYDCPPFRWDPERRFLLRCELDAAFFHLYGIERDDVDYIMETFPIVRRNDEKAHGEYRTKRVILEIYDEMAEAARTGKPYKTRLDPPPADVRVAHSPREDARVISLPLRPATSPQPAPAVAAVPDLAAIGANAWERPHTMERGEIQAAIIAVLKANGAPMDRGQARLAALLCLEPHLLATLTDANERTQWVRVVGGDAAKAANASIDATAQEWGAALTGLRGRGRLLEDLEQNTWALGTGTEAIDTSGWPEGRAGFVLNVLRRLQKSTQVDAIILTLPTGVQQWLADAA